MKSKRIIRLIIIISIFISNSGFSQENEQPVNNGKFGNRLFTGGNLGLQFGTETMIDVSPIIGYKFTKRFAAGIGIVYQYYSSKIYNTVFKTSIYGGSIFTRFYIIDNVFLHAEYEALSLETAVFDPYPSVHHQKRFWIGNPLAGGGYRQMIGDMSSFNIMILYNFNETIYTPYSNPIIRVGVNLGI